jgi:Do/DeqQ family serine protease
MLIFVNNFIFFYWHPTKIEFFTFYNCKIVLIMLQKFGQLILASFLGAALTVGATVFFKKGQPFNYANSSTPAYLTGQKFDVAGYPAEGFTGAADKVLPAVVHIRSIGKAKSSANSLFDMEEIPESFRRFFGDPSPRKQPKQEGTGSGVIISTDGFIVTNNHVVADADQIEITLHDRRLLNAKIIGLDPNTDVALIKVDAENLPTLAFADSDKLRVGEWVVAVGNPFNLASTVTAGIISAIGRSINILEGKAPIESFIQTDAVVNPGNSGGALVNTNGDLIGINTAIASPTGVFAGYSFAVPSNIVAKIVTDLREHGTVQRGYLGAIIRGIDGRFAQELNLPVNEGVYVDSVLSDGAAAKAGIKKGDIIKEIDGQQTATSAKLLELVGRKRPGDEMTVTILRNGAEKNISVTLRNSSGNTEIVSKTASSATLERLGATFSDLTKAEREKLKVEGVKVEQLSAGLLRRYTDIEEGFIITRIDRQDVKSVAELKKALENKDGGLLIEGRYPDSPRKYYYGLGIEE